MEHLFLTLVDMSLTAAYLVLAVLLLRLLLRRAPRGWLCLLWAAVGVRLVLPFSLESVFSLIPRRTAPLPELLPPADSSILAPDYSSGFTATVEPVLTPQMPPVTAPTAPSAATLDLSLTHIAAWVWLIGMAAMLAYALFSYLRIRHMVRESAPADDGTLLCDRISSPFILGVLRPRIYLPTVLSEQDAAYVIAHERAHLRRLDHLWKPLGFLLLCVYWFNPVLWLGYVLLCRDIELACDEHVIKQLGADGKKPYSEALINCSVSRRTISACPLAFGEVSVKQRIRSVLNYKKPTLWILILLAVALTVTALCFLTDPVQDDEQPDEPPADTQNPNLTPENTVTLSEQAHYFTTVERAWVDTTSSYFNPFSGGVTFAIDGDILYTVGEWTVTPVGQLRKMTLTEDNFDHRFLGKPREFTYISNGKEITATAATPATPIKTVDGVLSPEQLRPLVKQAYTCTLLVDDHARIELSHVLIMDDTTAYLLYSDTASKRYYSITRMIRSSPERTWEGGVLAIGDSVYHNMASSFADILSDTYYRISDDLSGLSVLREGSYTYIGAMAEIPIPEQYLNITEAPAFWSREVDIRSVLNESTRLFRISATETERAPTAPSHLLLTKEGDIYMVKGGGFSVCRMVRVAPEAEPENEGIGFYALALRDGGGFIMKRGGGLSYVANKLISGEPLPQIHAGDMLYIRYDGMNFASSPGRIPNVYSISVVSAYQATYGVEAPYHVTILDVDSDGKDEKCYITKSPTNNRGNLSSTPQALPTFAIFIRDAESNSTEYYGVFYAEEFDDFQLLKAEDGSVLLDARLYTQTEDGLMQYESVFYPVVLGKQTGKDIQIGEGDLVLYSVTGPLP